MGLAQRQVVQQELPKEPVRRASCWASVAAVSQGQPVERLQPQPQSDVRVVVVQPQPQLDERVVVVRSQP